MIRDQGMNVKIIETPRSSDQAHDVENSSEPVVSASYTAEVGTLIPQWSKKHTSSPLDVQK